MLRHVLRHSCIASSNRVVPFPDSFTLIPGGKGGSRLMRRKIRDGLVIKLAGTEAKKKINGRIFDTYRGE